jgi:flagellar basal body-associated protein FliL
MFPVTPYDNNHYEEHKSLAPWKIILITLVVVAFLSIGMYIFRRWFTSPSATSQQVVVGVPVPPVPLNQWQHQSTTTTPPPAATLAVVVSRVISFMLLLQMFIMWTLLTTLEKL